MSDYLLDFDINCCNGSVGYVLDGLPMVSEKHLKVEQQIELIRSWNLQPDFVINIKVVPLDLIVWLLLLDLTVCFTFVDFVISIYFTSVNRLLYIHSHVYREDC